MESTILFKSSRTEVQLHEIDGCKYAVKFISRENEKMMQYELNLLQAARQVSNQVVDVHPNLIYKGDFIGIATKYHAVSLFDYFRTTDGKLPPLRPIIQFAIKLADTLADLHDASIFHCDVKVNNIRVAGDDPVLIDFNSAMCSPKSSRFTGTKSYKPPEVVNGLPFDCAKCDVWALAVTIYFLRNRTFPPGDKIYGELHDVLKPALCPVKARCTMREFAAHLRKYV